MHLIKKIQTVFCFYYLLTSYLIHNLAIEKGRHDNIPKEERLCTFCDDNVLEDEFHAVMICEKYEEIRCFYIPQCYLNPPSIHNFNKLMSTQDDNTIFQLSFLYTNYLN